MRKASRERLSGDDKIIVVMVALVAKAAVAAVGVIVVVVVQLVFNNYINRGFFASARTQNVIQDVFNPLVHSYYKMSRGKFL